MNAPGLTAALQRSPISPQDSKAVELVRFGLMRSGGDESKVLEVTRATWQTETHGGSGTVLLMREGLAVVLAPVAQGLFRQKTSPPACVQIPFANVRDLIENDEDGPIIWFVGENGASDFLLQFERSAERDRMLQPIFSAHRGRFHLWAPQLDPASAGADFDQYMAEFERSWPADSMSASEWVEATYPEWVVGNALDLAFNWHLASRKDAAGRAPSARVGMVKHPWIWVDESAEARRVVVRLGEELFDAGLLAPPYTERSYESDEPLSTHDAGPARLLAAATVAGLAHAGRDPRAAEFIDYIRGAFHDVPPRVFSERLRELWADIAPLPAEGEMREMDIWEDADVAAIATVGDGGVSYNPDALTATDRAHVDRHMDAVSAYYADRTPETLAAACLSGVRAYEDLSPLAPLGWRKLVLFNVSEHAHRLWHEFGVVHDTAMLAQWVTVTIQAGGWGPDGNSTPLGQHHSYSMNLAGQTGVGIVVIDPETGMASAPTGEEARMASEIGSF